MYYHDLFFVSQILLRSQACHRDEVNLATLNYEDITGFRTAVSVSHYVLLEYYALYCKAA